MSEQLEQARASLERIQGFEVRQLSRKEQLGAGFAFDDVMEPATKVRDLFRQIPLDQLDQFPDSQLGQIKQQADAFYNLLSNILNFDPTKIDQNAKGERDKLVNEIRKSYQGFFNTLHPLIAFATSRRQDFATLESKGRAAIQAIEDQTGGLIEKLETYEQTARETLDEVRKVAAEHGVGQQAFYFKEESEKHQALADKWRTYTIRTAIGLGAYSLLTIFVHKWPWLAPATTYDTIQLAVSKILIFIVITYMLFLCARNFLAHTHNAIVNKQRQNALMTFKALADAARDEEGKDVVLTHAASCIFSPQDTGYAKPSAPSSGSPSPSILQILQYLTRAGHEST